MALECVCFHLGDSRLANVPRTNQTGQQNQTAQQHYCEDRKAKADLDLCKIVKRSRDDEQTKHNEFECHLKGERRQNLINKIKMYLDDYDDRPVMRSAGKKDAHTAKGQTGFGPMIKYPGYVDYDHPYFSDPFNRMPTLAMTVGQRSGENPCPPISVRNYDAGHGDVGGAYGDDGTAGRNQGSGPQAQTQHGGQGGGCHCAQRRSEGAKCPAALPPQPQPRQRTDAQQWSRSEMFGQGGVGIGPVAPPPIPTTQAPAMVCLCRTVN